MRIDDILQRIGILIKDRSNKAIAAALHVKPTTTSTWKDRNTINLKTLSEFCVERDIGVVWLLTGEGSPYKTNNEESDITEGHDPYSYIHPDILDILKCDNESLKRDLIIYAQRLKERKAEIEERKEMKALLDKLATEHQTVLKNEDKKISNSQTDDPDLTEDDQDNTVTGTWGY